MTPESQRSTPANDNEQPYKQVLSNQLSSLVQVADAYDVFLIDLWGVTHNGEKPFPAAISVYETLKAMGKNLVILSNAPRLPAITLKRLGDMGIDPALFDDVMTSGLECHGMLRDRNQPFYQNLGRNLYHIGPDRDRTIFDTLPYICVDSVDTADFLMITGTDGWEETTAAYIDRLQAAHDRNLPAVCANADKTVYIGDNRVICAGAIAEAYRTMGADRIHVHGKPGPLVFKAAHDLANAKRGTKVPLSRVLMLGDSLATDIKGSNAYGIDCVLALTGVHKEATPADFNNLFNAYHATPTYVMLGGIG